MVADSSGRLTRASAQAGTAVVTSTARLTRASAFGASGASKARLTRASASSTTSLVNSKARLTRASGTSANPGVLGARAGLDRKIDALVDVLLDGGESTGGWTSAEWTLTDAPPTAYLLGSGIAVILRAPANVNSYTITAMLSLSNGLIISVDTVTLTVYPWIYWRLDDTSALVPRLRQQF